MSNFVRGAAVLMLILLVTPTSAGPHGLSTHTPQGPTSPHAKQMTPQKMSAVGPTLPSAFLSSPDGNFQAQPLDTTHPVYIRSFAAPPTMPQIEHPSAGQLTRTGTAHKQFGLRELSIDPSAHTPATITAGEARLPIRSAPERSTRLSPGRDAVRRPASYGPHWLMVEVENLPATPHSAKQPGLEK